MAPERKLRSGALAWTRRNARDVNWEIARDLSNLAIAPGAAVADIGCGAKPYERFFPGAARYCGIDLPADLSANKLQKRADVYADLRMLPLGDESFDVVLCTQVLEHVPDPARVLGEAHRILRSGGLAVITVPFLAAEHEVPHDYLRFTSFGVTALLEQNGFEAMTVKKQFGFWSAIGEMIYWHYHRKVAGTRWEKYWYAIGTTALLRGFHLLNRVDPDDKLVLNLFVTARKAAVPASSAPTRHDCVPDAEVVRS
ncbi:MAG TPA: class I SAM-dependent methyltransferase [Candidatus Acidoferrales bacterium]|nr:class I SAM-dependent methyltransferase [Candidatus Acidoferrales bacterium]